MASQMNPGLRDETVKKFERVRQEALHAITLALIRLDTAQQAILKGDAGAVDRALQGSILQDVKNRCEEFSLYVGLLEGKSIVPVIEAKQAKKVTGKVTK